MSRETDPIPVRASDPDPGRDVVRTAGEFLARAQGIGTRSTPATLRAALLVSPIGFRVAEESAQDNQYMRRGAQVDPERAFAQHAGLARKLGELGVPVLTIPGREGLDDAVFPNNVYATTPRLAPDVPGGFIVGSMRHEVRRREAERDDVRSLFVDTLGYELYDLSQEPCIAELTGPLAIDHLRGIGYCGMTGRVDDRGVEVMHEAFDLDLTFQFHLVPQEYHTNLVLSILAGRAAILHAKSFDDADVPRAIASMYPTLELSDDEKRAFAGNSIAVTPRDVLFSATSMRALEPASIAFLNRQGFQCHGVEVDELEKGGGSLRCLIAEIF